MPVEVGKRKRNKSNEQRGAWGWHGTNDSVFGRREMGMYMESALKWKQRPSFLVFCFLSFVLFMRLYFVLLLVAVLFL